MVYLVAVVVCGRHGIGPNIMLTNKHTNTHTPTNKTNHNTSQTAMMTTKHVKFHGKFADFQNFTDPIAVFYR